MDNEFEKYEVNVEPVIRAIFFDSFYLHEDIVYEEAIDYVTKCIVKFGDGYWGKRYNGRDSVRLSVHNDKDEIDSKIRDAINQAYKKVLKAKKILAIRLPEDVNIPEERYEKIIISGDNKLEAFFNKRVIREWDFKYSRISKSKIIEIINSNELIRNKEKWLEALQ